MQQTVLRSQLQPSDERLTDSCACTHALSAPRPLRLADLEERTSQPPLSSQLVMSRSLSQRHPESGAVALLFCMSQSVSSRSGMSLRLCWSTCDIRLQPFFFLYCLLRAGWNRMGRRSSSLICVLNQPSCSVKNIRIFHREI